MDLQLSVESIVVCAVLCSAGGVKAFASNIDVHGVRGIQAGYQKDQVRVAQSSSALVADHTNYTRFCFNAAAAAAAAAATAAATRWRDRIDVSSRYILVRSVCI